MEENYPNVFSFIKSSSIDFQSGMPEWNHPTIIFYEKINSLFYALIEMKSFKLNFKKNIIRIFLNNYNLKELEKQLEIGFKEQKWVVIEGLDQLLETNLDSFLNILKCQRSKLKQHTGINRFKIWIFYRKIEVL